MHIITIDGPASSGKGTVAAIIASTLGFHYLESGAIYRVIGLVAKRNGLTAANSDQIVRLIDKINVSFANAVVVLDGTDVSSLIRREEIGMLASGLAQCAEIRAKLLDFQRSFAKAPGLVTDGRDMGSVVFPNADLKIFLTAAAETRAKRRFNQLHLQNSNLSYNAILSDILARDKRDSKRAVAPLSYDESFELLDNTDLTIDETIAAITGLYKRKCQG